MRRTHAVVHITNDRWSVYVSWWQYCIYMISTDIKNILTCLRTVCCFFLPPNLIFACHMQWNRELFIISSLNCRNQIWVVEPCITIDSGPVVDVGTFSSLKMWSSHKRGQEGYQSMRLDFVHNRAFNFKKPATAFRVQARWSLLLCGGRYPRLKGALLALLYNPCSNGFLLFIQLKK
jgi:hypothetical protein